MYFDDFDQCDQIIFRLFGPIHQLKFSQLQKMFAKVGLKCAKYLNASQKHPKTVNNSPNLVTLIVAVIVLSQITKLFLWMSMGGFCDPIFECHLHDLT